MTIGKALTEGLKWLYRTEQPEGAEVPTSGTEIKILGTRRMVQFVPRGSNGLPLVLLYATDGELKPGELDAVASTLAILSRHEGTRLKRWGGEYTSGCVELPDRAHRSLLQAVDRSLESFDLTSTAADWTPGDADLPDPIMPPNEI